MNRSILVTRSRDHISLKRYLLYSLVMENNNKIKKLDYSVRVENPTVEFVELVEPDGFAVLASWPLISPF